eukprot:gene14637-biopygen6594
MGGVPLCPLPLPRGARPRQKPLGGAGGGRMGGAVRGACGGRHFRDSPRRIPARKSAPRAARPPPPAARPGRTEGANGTGGWSSFSPTVSRHTVLQPWRPVGGNSEAFQRHGEFVAYATKGRHHTQLGASPRRAGFWGVWAGRAQGGGGGGGFLAVFVTGGSKRPGNSGLRAAIRTAAHARSGRANDTGGLGE